MARDPGTGLKGKTVADPDPDGNPPALAPDGTATLPLAGSRVSRDTNLTN